MAKKTKAKKKSQSKPEKKRVWVDKSYPTEMEVDLEPKEENLTEGETEKIVKKILPASRPSTHWEEPPVHSAKTEPMSRKTLLVILCSFLGVVLIIFIATVYISNNRESTINVQSPNVTTPNSFNHTIVNNNTITVTLDGEFARMIANQTIAEVRKQLNSTNSS